MCVCAHARVCVCVCIDTERRREDCRGLRTFEKFQASGLHNRSNILGKVFNLEFNFQSRVEEKGRKLQSYERGGVYPVNWRLSIAGVSLGRQGPVRCLA